MGRRKDISGGGAVTVRQRETLQGQMKMKMKMFNQQAVVESGRGMEVGSIRAVCTVCTDALHAYEESAARGL